MMFKTRKPKEFWKLINKESDHSCSASEITDFSKFINNFSELNRGSSSRIAVPLPMVQPLTDINDVINQPFPLDEIKIAIKINKI